ncbi:hypothetical protein V4D05_18720 [Vibrio mimicus]|uniref:hypothetical protein n=1 Tax=Vibrio mimicus TaxID=674 RepID=UPI002F954B10
MKYILYLLLTIATFTLCYWFYLSIVNDHKLVYTLTIGALIPPVLFAFRKILQIIHLKNKTIKDSYVALFDKTNYETKTVFNRYIRFYDILTTKFIVFSSTKVLKKYSIERSKIEPKIIYAKVYNCISVMNWISSTLAILILMYLNFELELVGNSDLANFWAQEKLEAFIGALLGFIIYVFLILVMLAFYNPLSDFSKSEESL